MFITRLCDVPDRSVAGSYDNEGIAIFALMFTYFLWIKSVKTGSVYWAAWTALSYFYMVSFELGRFFSPFSSIEFIKKMFAQKLE